MSRSAARRVGVPAVLGAALSGALTLTFAGGAAGQDPLVAFDASSSAMGVQLGIEVPGAPISSNVFDGGGPLAQAAIDGLGTSQGYASLPYPGDTVNTLPGLVLGLFGLPSLPSYPLQVSSQAVIDPQEDVSLGALTMRASSDDRGSSALARAGGGSSGLLTVGNIEAAADVGVDDAGTVVATARSVVESLGVAGILSIGSVRATAEAVRHSDGTTETTSGFEVEGLTIAGLHVSVTEDGIVLPGTELPIPGTSGLSSILDPTGITVEVLPEDEFEGGIRSRGIVVTMPAPGTLAQGRVTLTLGRATATSASTTGISEPPAGSVTPAPTIAPSSPAFPVSGTPVGPAPLPPAGPAAPSGPAPAIAPATTAAGVVDTLEVSSFYLVLLGGALAGIVSTTLLRTFGVKLAWTG